MRLDHVARFIIDANHGSVERLSCIALLIALAIASGSPYHSRPNGCASLIRSTPRGHEQRSVQGKEIVKRQLKLPGADEAVRDSRRLNKERDHVLTLRIEGEFQIVAVGFGLKQALQSKNQRSFMTQRSVFQRLYDYFYSRYGRVPKETLLELMGHDLDIERLRQLSQRELAEFYCQGLVYSAVGPDRIL